MIARKNILRSSITAVLAAVIAAPLAGAPALERLTATRGASSHHVALTWIGVDADRYSISRAIRPAGPFEQLDETTVRRYRDTSAEPGLLYWYRVTPHAGSLAGNPGTVSGYRSPPSPPGLMPGDLLKAKTLDRSGPPSTARERDLEERSLKYMAEYYEKPFMAWLIVTIGKLYINRGEVLAYRDLPHFTWHHESMTLSLAKPGVFHATFFSERFYRYVKWMDHYKIPREHLLNRSMANAIIFCIRAGEIEQRAGDGTVRYIPHMAVAGLSTEYFRNWKEWKSHSIMFASADRELSRRIREAWRQGASGGSEGY